MLDDANRRPRERLRRYLDLITDRLVEAEFSRGCLIGDFSLEAAPQSEMLRTRLAEIFAEWRTPFAACIAEGQAADEIAETFAPHDLAEFLLSSWEGAILRMKVERNAEPLERFKRIVFATVFKEPSSMNDITLPKLSVLDSEMAYREAGSRDAPVALFLHGNPTSSYMLAQHHSPRAPVAHCIAPDLIGFGQSGKPDIAYRFEDHVRYLDAFIAKAGIGSAYLVAQDWGTALAFRLAERRPDFVRGLAFMEFIRPIPDLGGVPERFEAREIFRKFRTPGEGEKLILEENVLSSSGCCRARCGASSQTKRWRSIARPS